MEKKQKPISIGFPVYNGASRMTKALDTLLGQTYKDFELIISDNASTDETARIAQGYAASDSRIRYIRQSENIGQVSNIKFVIEASSSKYFMLAADDDWWEPEFVECLFGALEANPYYVAAMSSFEREDERGCRLDRVELTGMYDLARQGYYSVFSKMIWKHPIHLFFYGLWRREFLARHFNRPIPRCIYWDRVFFAEVALCGHLYSIPDLLYHRRSNSVKIKKRYTNDSVGALFQEPYPYTNFLLVMLWRLVSSPFIPWYRKPLIFPPWSRLFWILSGSVVFECRRSLRSWYQESRGKFKRRVN
ncbi:MAG: glycosyltransferase family 2 protein [Patescibacteria group bacterium]|nr:glycosyltransferase family 2 protein [Patescibacteria group bacterium]